MLRKRQSAVRDFVGCSGVRRKKYPLAFNVYTNGAVAKRMFAHERLLSRVKYEKWSSKRSACSALSLSWSVGILVEKDDGLKKKSVYYLEVGSEIDRGLGVELVMLLDARVG